MLWAEEAGVSPLDRRTMSAGQGLDKKGQRYVLVMRGTDDVYRSLER